MRIPAFFNHLKQRYPQAIQPPASIPIIDNFYINLNGIIHSCFHPDGFNRPFPKSYEEVFIEIFLYIDRLLDVVKPRRLVYIAMNGVAPLAKWNQQRQRRFLSAFEAQMAEDEGKVKEIDSNCITPGTEFMVQLAIELKKYVVTKVSSSHQHLQFIFSDAQAPGEGEHKIMHFIRTQRQNTNYNPNTSHCIHGLDADLIFHALGSHEPNFYILCEVILFDKEKTICRSCGEVVLEKSPHAKQCPRVPNISEVPICAGAAFQFLDISVIRNYLALELQAEGQVFERALDDIIFLSFLGGNDFVPIIELFNIKDGAFGRIIQIYKLVIMPQQQFITNNGDINLQNFRNYLEFFKNIEVDFLLKQWQSDQNFLERERNSRMMKLMDLLSTDIDDDLKQRYQDELKLLENGQLVESTKIKQYCQTNNNIVNQQIQFKIEHANIPQIGTKEWYAFLYKETNAMKLSFEYIKAMLWICQYYFCVPKDWRCYYPFHSKPLIRDICKLLDAMISSKIPVPQFQKQAPFAPTMQLLAVLPSRSFLILPTELRSLMLEDQDLKINYPLIIQCQQFRSKYSSEVHLQLPFFDEKELQLKLSRVSLSDEAQEYDRPRDQEIFFNKAKFVFFSKILDGQPFQGVEIRNTKSGPITENIYNLQLPFGYFQRSRRPIDQLKITLPCPKYYNIMYENFIENQAINLRFVDPTIKQDIPGYVCKNQFKQNSFSSRLIENTQFSFQLWFDLDINHYLMGEMDCLVNKLIDGSITEPTKLAQVKQEESRVSCNQQNIQLQQVEQKLPVVTKQRNRILIPGEITGMSKQFHGETQWFEKIF